MVDKYCEVIDGKQIPTWALKPVDELDEMDIEGRARWNIICQLIKHVFEEPETWAKIVQYYIEKYPKKNNTDYFTNWMSEDYFYMKSTTKIGLDEKVKKAPLSEFTLRQIVNALNAIAYEKFDDMPIDDIKKFATGERVCST